MVHALCHETLPRRCDELANIEPVFARLIGQYGYPPLWHREPGFTTLAQIIIEQQVSLASALSIWKKLQAGLGEVSTSSVLAASDEQLRSLSVTRQKSRYLRELAKAVYSGHLDLDVLPGLPDDEVHARLTAVVGIGDWSATVYRMEALHHGDCFPLGDVALVNSMKHEFQLDADTSSDALLQRSEAWTPWRSAASFMLWHAYIRRKGVRYPWN